MKWPKSQFIYFEYVINSHRKYCSIWHNIYISFYTKAKVKGVKAPLLIEIGAFAIPGMLEDRFND